MTDDYDYNAWFDISPAPLFAISKKGLVAEANALFAQLLHLPAHELKEKEFTHLLTEKSHELLFSLIVKSQYEGLAGFCQFELKIAASSPAIVLCRYQSSINNPYIYFALQSLEPIQADSQNGLDNPHFLEVPYGDSFWDYDLIKQEIYYSPRCKALLGYEDDYIPNTVGFWKTLIHEEDLKELFIIAKEYVQGILPKFEMTLRFRHKDESTLYFLCRAVYIRNKDGRINRLAGNITDITEIKLTEEKLHKSRRLLSNAQDIARIGSWEIDLITYEVNWSAQMFRNFGMYPDEIQTDRHTFLSFVHPDDWAAVRVKWALICQSEQPTAFECRATRKDGENIILRVEGCAESDEAGNIIRVSGVVMDITTQKKVEQELISAKELAERSSSAKERFLSSMSHEMRTPMNAVIGMAHLLLIESPQEHQVENLTVLKFAANHLLELINDILDFSKIEAGKIVFEIIDFNLRELITNLVKTHALTAKEKKMPLAANVSSQIPELLQGDPVRLGQIITNLLSNAIKFTEKGSVVVDVSIREEKSSHIDLNFSVTDSGIGISEDKLVEIFDSFTQASSDITRRYGGTGLGLAITKNLVELQGGNIYVESKVGSGSTFGFWLSFAKSAAGASKKQEIIMQEEQNLSHLSIMVVEDNKANQLVISKFLKNWKANATICEGGFEALEKLNHQHYDLIFMDLHMPQIDGFETSQKIREKEGEYFKNVPIVALTASILSENDERIIAAGINDCVLKPFNPNDLYAKILQFTASKIPIPITRTTMVINFDKFHQITLGDKAFAQELMVVFIKQLEDYLADLQKCVETIDVAHIRFLNHNVRSTVVTLSIKELLDEQVVLNVMAASKELPTTAALQEKVTKITDITNELVQLLKKYE